MRIIMSGGGTGGHIYPAITILRAIERRVQACEILYVGTRYGLESDIVPKEGIPFITVDIKGLERRVSWQNVVTLTKTLKSLWESMRIIRKFRPDVVVGTGGYVCGPILLAASLLGIPTMIQEQNVIPGITNKILSKFVDKIAVGYEEAGKYFTSTNKVVFTGNPIRAEVLEAERLASSQILGLDPAKKTVLISGGSRGARSINQAMLDSYRFFVGKNDVQLLHVTGKTEYNDIVKNLTKSGIDIHRAGNIIIKPYLYHMPQALAVADLAVFRAGAIGLAELTARGIPAILVPYPYAAENHQEWNAKIMERHGAAVVVRDAELNGTSVVSAINSLINNPLKLQAMQAASKNLGRPMAADDIASLVLSLCSPAR